MKDLRGINAFVLKSSAVINFISISTLHLSRGYSSEMEGEFALIHCNLLNIVRSR